MGIKLTSSFKPYRISKDIEVWLDQMAEGLEPGRFLFCKHGGLIPSFGQQGQMTTCFAMKIAWQCGIWNKWTIQRQQASIYFIESFQSSDGAYIDPWLKKSCKLDWKDLARALIGRTPIKEAIYNHRYNDKANVRAETRQSAATLWMVNKLPKYELPLEIKDPNSFYNYIKKLNWRDPWHSGSHISHQLMMLSLNNKISGGLYYYDDMVKEVKAFLNSIYDKQLGTWHKGSNIDDQIKLNGAMKIYSGLQWLDGFEFANKPLIDFALSIPIQLDGCGFTNSLFAIRLARKGIENYRRDEIIERAIKCLNYSMEHKHKGSGYSFMLNEAQKFYYTRYASLGGNQADMHGTGMFVLGISIALELMGEHAPVGSETWKILKG